jgi:hypothetical protein
MWAFIVVFRLPATALVMHRKAVFVYRGSQVATRGGARCESKVLDRSARPMLVAPRRYLLTADADFFPDGFSRLYTA